jgi:phospholipase C
MRYPIILGCMVAAFAVAAAGMGAVAKDKDDKDDARAPRTPIKHLVVIFQENASFDHYFGTYPEALNPSGETKFKAANGTPKVNNLLHPKDLVDQNPNFQVALPFRLGPQNAFTCSEDHGYSDEQSAANGGAMDMFQDTSHTGFGCQLATQGPFNIANATDGGFPGTFKAAPTVMAYFDGNTVTALWNYAQNFAMNDNSFDSVYGPSTNGAINLVSGQTHGAIVETTSSSRNPTPVTVTTPGTVVVDNAATGEGTLIGDIDPFFDDCSPGGTAKFLGKNIGDLLNAKKVTWGWFAGGFAPTVTAAENGGIAVCGASHAGHPGVAQPSAEFDGPNPNLHNPVTDYIPHHMPFQYYASTSNPHHLPFSKVENIGKTDQANHQYDLNDLFTAIDAGVLPAVSFVKLAAYQDGHPGNSDPLSEQNGIVSLINALMQSPEWDSTAVIISWDDSDGWYDHQFGPTVNPSATKFDFLNGNSQCGAKPPAPTAFQGRCGFGPRLPYLVISPWAKANFVDHNLTDQSSTIRFIEANWDLGFIDGPTERPAGQASFDRTAGSIMNMFDFDERKSARKLILDPNDGTVVDEKKHTH